jgi:ribonuclease Z
MQLVFLGTSAMVPTKERNVSALFLSYEGEGILFDCGEGTQRQMNITGIKRTRVNKVLISHWHGDHVSGLIGLIQTLGNEENPKLEVYGPEGTKQHMNHLMNSCSFDARVQIKIHELKPKGVERFFNGNDFVLECTSLKHTTPCLGYSFVEKDRRKINMAYLKKLGVKQGPHIQQLQKGKSIKWHGKTIDVKEATSIIKGKKITYIVDTVPCNNAVELAKDADLLISEATYVHTLKEKAEQYSHLTARDAGLIANQANVKKLVITHFSQRYKNTQDLEEDARNVFDNVISAQDFMKIRI